MDYIPTCEHDGCHDNALKFIKRLMSDGSIATIWYCRPHFNAVLQGKMERVWIDRG